jgi:(2S)-methylsuccinyl-CoA dehydrogenase
MNAVAVTEPDFGSDVAGVKVTATQTDGGWLLNGVKTWCTYGARADVLMVLARTDTDRSVGHRGLSMFIVPKERGDGHGFELTQENALRRRQDGGPPDRHDRLPRHAQLRGGDRELVRPRREPHRRRGRQGPRLLLPDGRLRERPSADRSPRRRRHAGRLEQARDYANNRVVFGENIAEFQLTQAKLARMAVIIQGARQYSFEVARLMAKGEGAMEASMVKAYVCKAAEWVTREAMQIHGGMGYAEEYTVSRLFVDARVLSIFEGADEVLCVKVIARQLVGRHNADK